MEFIALCVIAALVCISRSIPKRYLNRILGSLSGRQRLAVLIDAENITYRMIPAIVAKARQLGDPITMRVYADFSEPTHKSWPTKALGAGLHLIHQPKYQKNKSSSDFALTVDAMDLLYSGRYDVFCLVTGDGDFTRLAQRIRDEGCTVYGISGLAVSPALIAACHDFFVFRSRMGSTSLIPASSAANPGQFIDSELEDGLVAAFRLCESTKDGWIDMGAVGSKLKVLGISPKSYGHSRVGGMLTASGLFELKEVAMPSGGKVQQVRLKTALEGNDEQPSDANSICHA